MSSTFDATNSPPPNLRIQGFLILNFIHLHRKNLLREFPSTNLVFLIGPSTTPLAMATAVLESLAVTCAGHGARGRYTPRVSSARVSAAIECWRADLMLEFKGLRVTNRPSKILSAGRRPNTRTSRRVAVICEAQNTTVDVPDVTKETWKSLVMESDKPVLVEFWAPWCGPCRIILPYIAKLSKTYEDKMKCFKLNTDESPDIATQYGIRSIPTVIIFKNGEKKDAVIGAVPESALITCIDKYV